MTLPLASILQATGIDTNDALAIRHVFIPLHEDTNSTGITPSSTDAEILTYTSHQSSDSRRFPLHPPRFWLVFIREGGRQARLWKVVENHGETSNDGVRRIFQLTETDLLSDLAGRLVIGWDSARTWWVKGITVARYPVETIADAEPIAFPGFDQLILSYPQLQAVIREPAFASWRTALSSVKGIYLITDTRTGRHYVGKAEGSENIYQRWTSYATTGHGGNAKLRQLKPDSFQFSLLRVFDPATPTSLINAAERHFKRALDTIKHGLNAN